MQNLNSETEFPDLLLIVERGQQSSRTKGKGHGSPSLGLNDAGNSRTKQEKTVSEGKLSAVVFVFLDQVTWECD